jgi:hypothetical protein
MIVLKIIGAIVAIAVGSSLIVLVCGMITGVLFFGNDEEYEPEPLYDFENAISL